MSVKRGHFTRPVKAPQRGPTNKGPRPVSGAFPKGAKGSGLNTRRMVKTRKV